jgi:hypothetical protein
MQTMLGWAFAPAEESQLLAFVEKGERDAALWVAAQGIATPTSSTSASRVVTSSDLQLEEQRDAVMVGMQQASGDQ